MKVGLIDVDGHNFPNLALMKISTHHKKQNDIVEWATIGCYDIIYKSKVFTFTPDVNNDLALSDKVIKGGTGYGVYDELFCDNEIPDYSLYPASKWYDGKTAYGFLTRGCIRKCPWCVVPKKEGTLHPYQDIEQALQGFDKIVLMDNNILACNYGIRQIEKIVNIGCKVDFNQGLDARLITDDIAQLLSKVKWLKCIRLAYDTKEQYSPLITAIERLNKYGIKNGKIFVYCLLQDLNDSYDRLNICKTLGVDPFAQPYRDFTPNQIIPQWQQDMARWCNHKAIFKSIDFKEYQPRKGFYCREYFNMAQ